MGRNSKKNHKRKFHSTVEHFSENPEDEDGHIAFIYPEARSLMGTELSLGLNGQCAVCGRNGTVTCPACLRICYCSATHQKRDQEVHEKACYLLQRNKADEALDFSAATLDAVWDERGEVTQLPQDWDEYRKTRFECFLKTGAISRKQDSEDNPLIRSLTNTLTYPLSLLHGLFLLRAERFISAKTDYLTIHMLGASEPECENPKIWRELRHYGKKILPELKKIQIVFVGPQLPNSVLNQDPEPEENKSTDPKSNSQPNIQVHTTPSPTDTENDKAKHDDDDTVNASADQSESTTTKVTDVSNENTEASRKSGYLNFEDLDMECFFYKGTYDEMIDSGPTSLPKNANLVVGYHMGLSCPDYEWQPTLQAIAEKVKAPLLATSSAKREQQMELLVLMDEWNFDLLVAPCDNPFASLSPLQSGTLANDIYFRNASLMAVAPRDTFTKRIKVGE